MKNPLVSLALLCVPLVVVAAPDPALVQKAEAGDPEAETSLFHALIIEAQNSEDQAETAKLRAEAEKYVRRAANRGYGPAQLALATYFEEWLEHTEENKAEAATWMRKAADQKIPYAQMTFGFWAAQGTGTKRDLATAVAYLKPAALAGDGDARRYLIKLYSEGEDLFGNKQPPDIREAIKWQEPVSLAPTARNYEKIQLARLYLQLPEPTDADRAKARKLVEAGLTDGGSIDDDMRYLLGDAVAAEMDHLKLLQAATAGHAPAQYLVAKYLEETHPVNGEYVDGDPDAAAGWYRKAAEQNHVEAMIEWSFALASGQVVPKDPAGALRFMRAAAETGNQQAQANLESWYREGRDQYENPVPLDLREALRWQRELTKSGYEHAYVPFGETLLKLPDPDPADLAEAARLLEQKIAGGDKYARPTLDAVQEKLATLAAAASAARAAKVAQAAAAKAASVAAERAAVMAALAARYEVFEKQFNSTATAAGRRRTFSTFERWIRWQPYGGVDQAERGEWVLRRMIPLLERHPSESFWLLAGAAKTVLPDEMVARVLPDSLQGAYRAGRERLVRNYEADEKHRAEIRRKWTAAHAGDGQAQLALGLAYFNQSDIMESSDWAHAAHWLRLAHEKNIPGAAEPFRKLAERANARMKAAREADDFFTLVEMYIQKAGSPQPDATASAAIAGKLLLNAGRGDAEDIREAVGLLEPAADKGNADAMFELGQLYVLHDGQPIDEAKALDWFQRAARAGHSEAKAWVELLSPSLDQDARGALAYKMGQDRIVTKENGINLNPALPWMRFAARLKHGDAMTFMTLSMEDGEEIYRVLTEAAGRGSVKAMTQLGYGLRESDPAEARHWWQKAAETGDKDAQHHAAWMMLRGEGGPVDLNGAREWFLRAADQGSHGAMFALGEIYHEGKGVARSASDAAKWWQQAALAGDFRAQYRLALLHEKGEGVTRDPARAQELLLAAAKGGSPEAKEELQKRGIVVAATPAQNAPTGPTTLAQDQAGAKAGDAESMKRLAERYEVGDGVGMDIDIAYDWFRRAAALGDAEAKTAMVDTQPPTASAMYRLARRYEIGDGVAKDLRAALHWYDKAAAAGHKDAEDAWEDVLIMIEREDMAATVAEQSAQKKLIDGDAPLTTEQIAKMSGGELLGAYDALLKKEREEDPEFAEVQAASLAAFFGDTPGGKKTIETSASGNPASDSWVPRESPDVLMRKAQELATQGQTAEAEKLIQRAAALAETANGANQYFLATVLKNGLHGVTKDPARATTILILSAEVGYVPAQIDYAKLLIGGAEGVTRDMNKAEMMFLRAVSGAENKSPEERMAAAMLLTRDNLPGITPDRARAFRLVESAADAGLPAAQIEYGRALFLGVTPVTKDQPRAVAYLMKAADKFPQARYLLGQAHELGIDGKIDLKEALKWYNYAGGFQDAVAKVTALQDKLGERK